ncbi:MAG: SPOR domain-containing protein [Gammaproteobacteria bacterium]|uniref:SPOR domain-containing protein n=1 Tax=Rhodoferax sp. TaxID=50421 RepID=UPI00185B5298|nr:SPOR domain-containing protein [Rhodoferax sp.]MBU3900050.1 SPOR domain-containing protein [Gammaproteobacteria bacterium]MBA3059725.1 sporulation protein [Rhodoferax sp.]MBU3999414.1 SPOR domain-containing protein [Gammaproteobacteria bacterium]MBU4082088.1 SPOR domain-containing protein [Gammaproteobacteria bacterium]MBU4113883.1 SPOR domain-containing protein [Gammaproteobacteria bacterium]
MPSPATPAPPDTTTLDRSSESATDALYRAAIGPINAVYYVPIFARFEAAGRGGPSWNWAASLYTLNWMIFRRLWVAAVLYLGAVLGLLLMVFGLGRVLFQWSGAAELAWLAVCGGLGSVLPGVFGNAIFHARSRQKMAAALSASPTLKDACQRLSQQASTRQRFLRLVAINLVLAGAAALTYAAWPDATPRPVNPVTKAASGQLAPPLPRGTSPSADGLPFEAPVQSLGPAPVVAPTHASSASVSAPAGAKLIDPPTARMAAPAASVTPANSSASSVAGQRYLINVGLFAIEANARAAYAKLQAAGLPASRQTLKGRTRVRVGPFASEHEAQAVAEKIRALQLDAVVFQP